MKSNILGSKNKSNHTVKHKKQGVLYELSSNRTLYIMILPALAFLIVFSYFPMMGIQIAFKDYNVIDGIWKSPVVGLRWFEIFFKSSFAPELIKNTLLLNFLFIISGTVAAVTVAVLLNEMVNTALKKIFQSLMFLPHFMSWVIVSGLVYSVLNDKYGALNTSLKSLGLQTHVWYNMPQLWRGFLTIINTWQSYGYLVVIYLAIIVAIDREMYESAKIDGANRFDEIFRITIPHLIPTVTLLTLISLGRIFFGNFSMLYAIVGDNGLIIQKTDIIDTFVFRTMKENGDFSMATAIGLFQSTLGFILVVLCDKLVKKYDKSMGLF